MVGAKNPVLMSSAMRKGTGAGRMPKRLYATASSPLEGKLLVRRGNFACESIDKQL